MPLGSFIWSIGLFEALIGLGIMLGLLTRLAAASGIIIMIGAWFTAHTPAGWNPFANGGELALLYLATFIVILIHGSGKFGIEHIIRKKEVI
jgi:uncharacterized membrane protein YphA (DoxX/SURF4 family)